MNGEFTGAYTPYGYKKNPNNKHQLIVNEETAKVVKRIFQMACEGLTAYQICRVLKNEKILKPRAQVINDTGRYYNPLWVKHPYDWSTMTIYAMIKNEEYLGHLVCNKASPSSCKSKKLLPVDKDKMKKILKILLTIIFIVISIFVINKLINNFLNDSLLFVVLAFTCFAMHLFAWIAPKTFFNLCWKIIGILPDNYDYDTSYSKLEICDIGLLITSILLIGISLLFK